MLPWKPSNKLSSPAVITEVTPQKVENKIIDSKKEYSRTCKITQMIQHMTDREKIYLFVVVSPVENHFPAYVLIMPLSSSKISQFSL